mmetsp:Transcript_2871/g.5578  ORF Transcript_2871/g.5578 Transcript_2871/m.5578 type:complete len:342 (-) Transcript_2871:198-1223(-)|eukprot:scaffold1918_cov154-Amphora_coffeaeformis.AAC.9
MSTTLILWPPPTVAGFDKDQRVDLLELVPPNRFDDFSLPNREQQIAGVTLRADRVIMDRERYPDCERATQHKLSDDIQASCREQGHCMSVKEWADKNQHRGTLRLRLRCRSSACRFQFQLNWDSKAQFWYISRRRCGTFVHTCVPQSCQPVKKTVAADVNAKRHLNDSSSSNKRARTSPSTTNSSTAVINNTTKTNETTTKTQGPETTVLDALDSARSLLDLSRAPSSPGPASPTNVESQTPPPQATPTVTAPVSPDFAPVRLGNRFFLQPTPTMIPGGQQQGLTAQQKLALLRNADSYNTAALKAALAQHQQRCFPGLMQAQDASLLGVLSFQGGAFGNI